MERRRPLVKWKSITSTLNHLNWFRHALFLSCIIWRREWRVYGSHAAAVSTAGGALLLLLWLTTDHSYQHNYKLGSRLSLRFSHLAPPITRTLANNSLSLFLLFCRRCRLFLSSRRPVFDRFQCTIYLDTYRYIITSFRFRAYEYYIREEKRECTF